MFTCLFIGGTKKDGDEQRGVKETQDLCGNAHRAPVPSLGNEYVLPSRGSQTQVLWSCVKLHYVIDASV